MDRATSRTSRCNPGSGVVDAAVIGRPRDLVGGLPTTGGPGARSSLLGAVDRDEDGTPNRPPAQRRSRRTRTRPICRCNARQRRLQTRGARRSVQSDHARRRRRRRRRMFRVETLVTGRLHPDPADARSPLLRAFRMSGSRRSPRAQPPAPRLTRPADARPDMKRPGPAGPVWCFAPWMQVRKASSAVFRCGDRRACTPSRSRG
jgi:hypothetical protein